MDFHSSGGLYDPPMDVRLKNENLWMPFYKAGTEMIITKAGRRMFPSFDIYVKNLDPNAHYCVALEFHLTNHCRYKYSTTGGWAPAGTEEAQSVHRFYLHPDSPATGDYWMRQSISFSKLKLTNNPSPPPGQIVLSSMHKYQPIIVIAKTMDPRAMRWSAVSTHTFKETEFVAVTAYQNETITQLKIDNNPFAKGFRENGHSKTKKRKQFTQDDDGKKSPTKMILQETKGNEDVISVSSTPPMCDSPNSLNTISPPLPGHPLYPPIYDLYHPSLTHYYYPYHYHNPYVMDLSRHNTVELDNNNNDSKTFTNFTIDAILNSK